MTKEDAFHGNYSYFRGRRFSLFQVNEFGFLNLKMDIFFDGGWVF